MSVHSLPTYERRRPENTLLYKVIAGNLNTFLAHLAEEERSLPPHIEKELRAYLECGVLAYGFLRVKCQECSVEKLCLFHVKKEDLVPVVGAIKWQKQQRI